MLYCFIYGGITMKSIQSKILMLIISAVMISSVISGGIGIFRIQQAIDDESVEIMNLLCSERAQEFNNILEKIEQSTRILAEYTSENFDLEQIEEHDMNGFHDYVSKLDALGRTVAAQTNGAVAVYVRFCPELTNSNEGFFQVKNKVSGTFDNVQISDLTDLSQYDKNDMEAIGWYLVPVEAGEPVWIGPYENKRIGIYMISYVIPVYNNHRLIGIVGMDIDFKNITNECDSIKIYDSGSAFLIDNTFHIVHSKSFAKGTLIDSVSESLANAEKSQLTSEDRLYDYTIRDVKKRVAFRKLQNGMYLAVTAPKKEIDSMKHKLIFQIAVISFFIMILFLLIAKRLAKTIVRPLIELNEVAKKIADGNLDVSFTCKTEDEVGTLAKSFMETAHQLKKKIDYINNLAFVDKLTNIKNNTAYLRDMIKTDENIKDEKSGFSVFVVDVNGLKEINDTYGHDYGNRLIIGTSKAIVRVFGYENTYRIGGDEFAVILNGAEESDCSQLMEEFEQYLQNPIDDIMISAAIGAATYDPKIDENYESVFKRADSQMYKKKVQMKSEKKNSYGLSRVKRL